MNESDKSIRLFGSLLVITATLLLYQCQRTSSAESSYRHLVSNLDRAVQKKDFSLVEAILAEEHMGGK